jgi:O-antigen ligase
MWDYSSTNGYHLRPCLISFYFLSLPCDLCFLVSPLLPFLLFALVLPNMYLAVADALFGMAMLDLLLPLPLFAPLAYPTGWRPINLALKSKLSTHLLGATHRMLGQEGQT